MDSGSIDVKLISGKDLKAFNFFQKLTIYAQVSIFTENPDKKLNPDQKQQQRSPTDRENDGNPEWNHQMRFRFNPKEDSDHLFLQFELFSGGVMFGDKPIGEVRVPISDLIQDSGGIVRFVSYQVRSPDGKPNGVLDFSFKVNFSRSETETDFPVTSVSGHMAGFPAATHNHIHHQNLSLYPPVEFDHAGPPLIPYPPSTEAGYYPPPETYYPPPPPPWVHHLPPPPSPPHGEHRWGSSPYLGGYDYGDQGSPRPYHHSHSSSWNGGR